MTKEVSGTIMLHLEDGSKRFLVHQEGTINEFARTEIKSENTVLANFLNFLKNVVLINVDDIRLVELTNTQTNGNNVPLYVFEMAENKVTRLPEGFVWETPDGLREILGTFEISGMPIFN
ncbi:hypothetical protein NRIC_26940 [Enterococcus florum]|uniref:Uncharacterized protein n=1 Tax=Enterococcus florum TaxID=2480627 RepID=A0A4P5PNS1_9ENTE|nr:hypothetical protein NRIC_26940 [Enterococcus florum]